LGFNLDYDFNDLKTIEVMSAYRHNKFNLFTLNYNVLDKIIKLNGTEKLNEKTNFSFELEYDVKSEKKGFMEKPFSLTTGVENILS